MSASIVNRFKYFLLALIALVAFNASATEVVFVPSLPDVPLPKGFEVDPNTGTFFDSAEGRIVEMYAAGYENADFVEGFYLSVMKNFGWQKLQDLTFAKEGEILAISFEKGDYINFIKYQLKPNKTLKIPKF